jgi:hypothetical protein
MKIMTWRKSSRSETAECVEVRGDLTALRDSKNPGVLMPVERASLARLTAFARIAIR